MPTLPLTERAAMARRIAASRVSSVLSGVGRGQRAAVAVRSAAMIPVRTSGGRLAHDATSRARSASGGALPPSAVGRDVGGTDPPVGPPVRPRPAPRLAPGAARAAPGAARCSESAYSPGDSASARGFDSPRLHSSDPPPRALFPSSPAPGARSSHPPPLPAGEVSHAQRVTVGGSRLMTTTINSRRCRRARLGEASVLTQDLRRSSGKAVAV